MKKRLLGLIVAGVFAASAARAVPLLQHTAKGTVQAVDAERRTVTLEPGKKAEPAEFVVVEGRTKLRRDGRPAALAELAPGATVRIHYKRESGRCVAIEVSWSSAQP